MSVLSLDCPLDIINSFGMRSGRVHDKFDNIEYKADKNNNPYLKKHTIAYMSLEVTSILDMRTHYLFICDVVDAGNIEEGQPMTYADYRALKSGRSVNKTDNNTDDKVYVCTVCHYVYDQDTPFEELPDDWLCPVCKQPKSKFLLES